METVFTVLLVIVAPVASFILLIMGLRWALAPRPAAGSRSEPAAEPEPEPDIAGAVLERLAQRPRR